MAERRISEDEVREAIEDSKASLPSRGGLKVAQKPRNGKFIRVVFRREESKYIIITTYLANKERYEELE